MIVITKTIRIHMVSDTGIIICIVIVGIIGVIQTHTKKYKIINKIRQSHTNLTKSYKHMDKTNAKTYKNVNKKHTSHTAIRQNECKNIDKTHTQTWTNNRQSHTKTLTKSDQIIHRQNQTNNIHETSKIMYNRGHSQTKHIHKQRQNQTKSYKAFTKYEDV